MYFQGVDLAQSGMVYGPGGWLCAGQTYASTVGALYVEQNINAAADGAGGAGPPPPPPPLPPGATAPPIVGRVRMVTVYTGEGHLRGLSLFRERPSLLGPALPHPTAVPAEAAASDFPAAADLGSADATPAALVGTWAGTAVAVTRAGATSAPTAYTLTVGLDGSALSLTTAGDDTGGGGGGGGGGASPPSRTGTVTPGGRLAVMAGGGESGTPTHFLFLGGGVTALLPGVRPAGVAFGVELGWLTGPDSRLRIVRRYGADGSWVGSTFLRERRDG